MFDVDNTLVDFMKFKNASVDAAIDAMIASTAQIEHDIQTLTDEHPLYKLFPEFVEKIEKARGI